MRASQSVNHPAIQPFSHSVSERTSKRSRTLLLSINRQTIEELPKKKQTFKQCKSNILIGCFRLNLVTCLPDWINAYFANLIIIDEKKEEEEKDNNNDDDGCGNE